MRAYAAAGQAFGLDDFDHRDWYFKVGSVRRNLAPLAVCQGRLTIQAGSRSGFVAFPGLETEDPSTTLRAGSGASNFVQIESCAKSRSPLTSSGRFSLRLPPSHWRAIGAQGHPKDEDLSLGTPDSALR